MSLGISNTLSSSSYYQYRSIKGMNFDGTDDNCYNDANPGVNLFTAHTLSAWFRTTDVTGEVELPSGTEMVMPGDDAKFTVKLITPIAMSEKLNFAIREGGKTVGAGVVTKILE